MSSKIRESRLIPYNMQAGDGVPTHLSPAGTFYFDNLSGVTYQNIDGINNWSSFLNQGNQAIDIYVTGGTYNVGTATFTNNTGGTFSVTGFSSNSGGVFTGGTVSGATQFTSGLTANTISATTLSATTLFGNGSNLTGLPSSITIGTTPIISGTTGRILFQSSAATVNQSSDLFFDNPNGRLSLGAGASPTATLHIKSGTPASGSAPLKLTSGTNMTTPEAGAMEFNGANLFFTPSSVRNLIPQVNGSTPLTSTRIPFATTNGRLTDDVNLRFTTSTGAITANAITLGLIGAQVIRFNNGGGYGYIGVLGVNRFGVNGGAATDSCLSWGNTFNANIGVGLGTTLPTGRIQIAAGTSAAGSAPLKFTSGTNLNIVESGATEFNGTNLFFSPSTTRNILAQVSGSTPLISGTTPVATANGYLTNGLVLASGTYTPTLTPITNVTSLTAYTSQYMRVGSVVTVSGKFDITPTGNNTRTTFAISLPIATNFSAQEQCGGTGNSTSNTLPSHNGAIYADATNDRAEFDYYELHGATDSFSYTFTYQII